MIVKLEHVCQDCGYKIKKYWGTEIKTLRARRFFEIHREKFHKKKYAKIRTTP